MYFYFFIIKKKKLLHKPKKKIVVFMEDALTKQTANFADFKIEILMCTLF